MNFPLIILERSDAYDLTYVIFFYIGAEIVSDRDISGI